MAGSALFSIVVALIEATDSRTLIWSVSAALLLAQAATSIGLRSVMGWKRATRIYAVGLVLFYVIAGSIVSASSTSISADAIANGALIGALLGAVLAGASCIFLVVALLVRSVEPAADRLAALHR